MTSRRTLLKTGVAGGVVLAVGGLAATIAGRDAAADRAGVLRAVIPALLGDALPAAPQARGAAIERCREMVDAAIAGLSAASRRELDQLFSLLAMPPTRVALAGVTSAWDSAGDAQVSAFLARWREHRVALMQSGYLALHDLVAGAWYSDPASWPAIGYPGPIAL